ncbi:apical junction component 1 homolog [Toxotes jaculatrix]|uniref:apical junction component 1 homolog n=1 Tax=Toxotes jaculatrix TaxID=941984 RepID=UPI001B3B127D|nr:apical junction component 1 homolog [Toxotes jaculatrix]
MTRTDPPDILVSTVHRDIKVIPISSHYKSLQPSKQCDSINYSTVEDSKSKVNKRHCRTFDYKSLEYPKSHIYSMESPYRKADRHAANPDVAWNALGRQQRYRFSAPDIFSHRLTPQPMAADMASDIVVPEQKRRTRSKSAPRVQTSLTPVSFEGSSSSGRKGRESQRAPRDSRWRPEVSPRRESSYAATRAHMHEVHPIKLQPQMSDSSRYSPHFAADNSEGGGLDKPATSPHVRCRVDIKPDDAELHHPGQKQATPQVDIPWQRHHSGGSRSLTVPRHFSYSRTPTPTDSLEPQRIGTDSKSYSRSWDNILNSRVEREQPLPVQRGQSYDDLLDSRKPAAASGDKPQPVVVNLSSSPRRYAALSMSDNSLIDKSPTEMSKSTTSKLWFVTPEITITDNDIRPGNLNKAEGRSASWDILDSRSTEGPELSQRDFESSTKEKTHDNASLQQSLEQLDELLADLVTDYKPPSRRASEDILDQLKKLIDEEEAVSLSRKSSKAGSEEPAPLDNADECSPDQSPDEDDTMMCSNNKCRRTETLFNACLYFKSCHSCYTYYCSRNCRREDWDIHKESCLYGRIGSTCRHIIKHCRETVEVHKAFSRIAKVGYLSRGRGVLFLGFPNPASSSHFLQYGLDSLLMSPTYLSLRELESFKDNLGEYCKELQEAGKEYDPNECFILNVSIAVGEQLPDGPSPRNQAPTVRKYAKVALASFSPERKVHKKESDMETLILTPPPGTADIDKVGEEGRKAREICFINIQRELRIRGVFLRHEYPQVYQQLCEFVESNRRFTPTTIYPIDKRTGKQFMCMIMAASEPRTLDWVGTPHLLDDII